MYISKPLRWKHLELSEKKIKNQQAFISCFFGGQPIDSAGGGPAYATCNYVKILGFFLIKNEYYFVSNLFNIYLA
jgi:hypothetical protein